MILHLSPAWECWLISCFRFVQKIVVLILFSSSPWKLHENFIFGFHLLCINGVMRWQTCCAASIPSKECGTWVGCVFIRLEIRTVFPMPLSYLCSARFKGPWCMTFLGRTKACSPQSLSPKVSSVRRDDTAATHIVWPAPLLNAFMLCLENTDKLTWIQDDSKHVLSLRHGVSSHRWRWQWAGRYWLVFCINLGS